MGGEPPSIERMIIMPLTIEERRQDILYIQNEIGKLDAISDRLPDLTERNNLVILYRKLMEKVPPMYEPSEYVLVKMKRRFKAKIISITNEHMNHYEILPIDKVVKQEQIVSEIMLEPWTEEMENEFRKNY